MRTQTSQWRRRSGARHAARSRRGAAPAPAQAQSAPAPEPMDDRFREASRTEDAALYVCDCGHDFRAVVSTTVACPRCGDGQAW